MVLTMADTAPPTALTTLCPSCGSDTTTLEQTQSQLLHAHARIAELESQVRLLNQKATAAVDRWADYEDELTRLRAQHGGEAPTPPPPPPKNDASSSSSPIQNSEGGGLSSGGILQTGTNRLSSLLSRKSTPNLAQQQQQRTQPDTEDLIKALTREKSLRKEAEGRIAATSREVEELSASLFEQANEMVADERRARAKLEERVGELERRDREKRRRLERLESAMTRIERVRNLLNEG